VVLGVREKLLRKHCENFLNGFNGFYWSAVMSFYHFVKYIKLEDLVQADSSLSYTPLKSKKSRVDLHASYLQVSEYGSLVSHKKNGRL